MGNSPLFLLLLFLFLLLLLLAPSEAEEESAAPKGRKGRRPRQNVSLFSVIRFPNDPCVGSGNKNGTCYTREECEERGGTGDGGCASDYGVCCVCEWRSFGNPRKCF